MMGKKGHGPLNTGAPVILYNVEHFVPNKNEIITISSKNHDLIAMTLYFRFEFKFNNDNIVELRFSNIKSLYYRN